MLKELVNTISADQIPEGFKTTDQWAVLEKVSPEQCGVYLRKGLQLGLIEMKKFRVNLNGVVRPVPHYKLKDLRETKKKV